MIGRTIIMIGRNIFNLNIYLFKIKWFVMTKIKLFLVGLVSWSTNLNRSVIISILKIIRID